MADPLPRPGFFDTAGCRLLKPAAMRTAIPTRRLPVTLAFATLFALTACGGDTPAPERPDFPQAPIAGVYDGVFPCDNCPGIDTTLWLRSDGTFFTRRRILDESGDQPDTAYNLGRWRVEADRSIVVLEGQGPVRRYRRSGPSALELETGSGVPHRLDRDVAAGPFTDVLRMTGHVRVDGDGARFRECRSGLAAGVARAGDYRRFLHQYRTATAPGQAARVELEGRFSWAADGSPDQLTILRFVSVSTEPDCPGSRGGSANVAN